jgi:hypothetical protein
MDKIDLIVLPIIYLLWIAIILLHLYLNYGARLYNYWCKPSTIKPFVRASCGGAHFFFAHQSHSVCTFFMCSSN